MHNIADFRFVLGLQRIVRFFFAIYLHLGVGRQMGVDFLLGIRLALVFTSGLLKGWPVLLLVWAVTRQAFAFFDQRLCDVGINFC